MALSELAYKVENVVYRAGDVLVRPNLELGGFPVVNIDTTAEEFHIEGDQTEWFEAGVTLRLLQGGSVSTYTASTVTYNGGSNQTEIAVGSDLTDNTTAGTLLSVGDFYSLGKVKETMVNWEPVETDPDTRGQTKQLSLDFECTAVMQQTSDTEISNLDLITSRGMDVLFAADTSRTDETIASPVEDPDWFSFRGVTLTTNGELSMVGDESTISITLKTRLGADDLTSNVIKQS